MFHGWTPTISGRLLVAVALGLDLVTFVSVSVASGHVFLLVGSNSSRRNGTDLKTCSDPKITFWQAQVRQFRWPSKGQLLRLTLTEQGSWRQGRSAGQSVGAPARSRTFIEMGQPFHVKL